MNHKRSFTSNILVMLQVLTGCHSSMPGGHQSTIVAVEPQVKDSGSTPQNLPKIDPAPVVQNKNQESPEVLFLRSLIELSKNDPASEKIIKDAFQVLNVKDASELSRYISICDPKSQYGGLSDFNTYRLIKSKPVIQKAELDDDQDFKSEVVEYVQKQKGVLLSVEDKTNYFTAKYGVYRICISNNRPLIETYGHFIHELSHVAYTGQDLGFEQFLEQIQTPAQFINQILDPLSFRMIDQKSITLISSRSGSELEAYAAGYRAVVVASGSKQYLPSQFRNMISADGSLVDAKQFYFKLLQFLGLESETSKRALYRKELLDRFENLSVYHSKILTILSERMKDQQDHLNDQAQFQLFQTSIETLQKEVRALSLLKERYLLRLGQIKKN